MLFNNCFSFYILVAVSTFCSASNVTDIFQRPIVARVYQSQQYALSAVGHNTGDRLDISQVATALAGLKPSYVNGLIYLSYGDSLTDTMISDFNGIRDTVLAASPNAKFDIEISLNLNRPVHKPTFPSAQALVSFMETVDNALKLDGWWFDFWSTAQMEEPDWVVAAIDYAHNRSQTVGGNVFDTTVPPGSDIVGFFDFPDNSTAFGFGINAQQVAAIKDSSPSTIILGHLSNNPQNGNSTEACTYIYDFNSTQRADYLNYWLSQQGPQGFTYMFPVFFPLCPATFAFNPLTDYFNGTAPNNIVSGSNATLYDYIQAEALGNTTSGTTTTNATASSTSSTSSSTPSNAAGAKQMSASLMCAMVLLASKFGLSLY